MSDLDRVVTERDALYEMLRELVCYRPSSFMRIHDWNTDMWIGKMTS